MYTLELAESGLFIVIHPITSNHKAKGFHDVEAALHAIWVLEGKPKNIMYGTVGVMVYPYYRRATRC